jgi:hypothetical protein
MRFHIDELLDLYTIVSFLRSNESKSEEESEYEDKEDYDDDEDDPPVVTRASTQGGGQTTDAAVTSTAATVTYTVTNTAAATALDQSGGDGIHVVKNHNQQRDNISSNFIGSTSFLALNYERPLGPFSIYLIASILYHFLYTLV